MKLLTLKFILIFIYLISSSSSYAIQQPNLKNLVIHKDPKKLEKINFKNINNEIINLNKFENSLVIINFWATWCAPCVKEIPHFEYVNQKYSSDSLKVILASFDYPSQIDSKLIPFLNKNEIKSDVVLIDDLNIRDWMSVVSESWDGAIPATLIINKRSQKFYPQVFDRVKLENELSFFLE